MPRTMEAIYFFRRTNEALLSIAILKRHGGLSEQAEPLNLQMASYAGACGLRMRTGIKLKEFQRNWNAFQGSLNNARKAAKLPLLWSRGHTNFATATAPVTRRY